MRSIYIEETKASIRYYIVEGRSPTIVYLPGLGTPGLSLLDTANQDVLREHYMIFIDYFGCGMSDNPKFSHTMEDLADIVIRVLEKEGIESAILMGHSMGGTIAAIIAIKRPDLASKLIMAEANLHPGGGPGSKKIASMDAETYIRMFNENIEKSRQYPEDTYHIFHLNTWGKTDPLVIHKQSKGLVQMSDLLSQLRDLDIPKFFIYGDKNVPISKEDAMPDTPHPEDLNEIGIITLIIEHSGHLMMIDNVKGFAKAISDCVNV
ncbi:MAG: alpha/beta hydrolase [Candidatus Heimdallarchaeota archaeon]|nr:alpha/beta hydrolase [Candidatus Heimdallarchaeota archaeon]